MLYRVRRGVGFCFSYIVLEIKLGLERGFYFG